MMLTALKSKSSMKSTIVAILFVSLSAVRALATGEDTLRKTYVSRQVFDSYVDSGLVIMNKYDVLDTSDFIFVIRIDNTIFKHHDMWEIERYRCFQKMLFSKHGKNIDKVFFTTLNRGMGFYIKKYNLDWGGAAPNDNSLFYIID